MRLVLQARGRARGEKVAELGEAARGPGVTSSRVSLVAHDVSVIPAAAPGPGTSDIGDRAVTVMNSSEEMGDLVSGHNDAAVASAVLDNGHAVDLAQPLVHHARAADVGIARGVLVALALGLFAAHVKAGQSHHKVEDRELGFCLVEMFTH